MRRGQTFAQAYFDRPVTPRYAPPRKFFLGGSTYRDGEGGEGHAYERGAGSEGRQLVSSSASINSGMSRSTWEGHATREEYELDIKSSLAHGSQYDYAEATVDDDKASLLPPTTSISPLAPRSSTTAAKPTSPGAPVFGDEVSAASQPPPLPPYPHQHVEAPATSPPPLHILFPPTAPLRIVRSPSNGETTSALATATAAAPEIPVSGAALSRQPTLPHTLPPIISDTLISPITVSLPVLDDPSNPFPSSLSAPRPSLAQSLYSQTSAILSSISVENSPIDPPAGENSFSGQARRCATEAEHEGSVLFHNSLESRPSIKSLSASVQESVDEDGREREEETLVAGSSAEGEEDKELDEKTKVE